MKASVIIPFRNDSVERAAALNWVEVRWVEAGFETHVAHDSAFLGPWCKARAIQRGVDATDGDVLVIADADCWCPLADIRSALAHVDGVWARWALPHRRVLRLDRVSTYGVLNGVELRHRERLVDDGLTFEEPPYSALAAAGGIVMLTRELWNRVPMDPRFVGWGFEDVAWFCALRTLDAPAWRGRGDLWHLWHERNDAPGTLIERGLEASPANRKLLDAYQAARLRPGPMGLLIDDAKTAMATTLAAARSGQRRRPAPARETS